MEVRGSRATIDYIGHCFGLRGRRSIWGPSGSFCVAGAALGAPWARLCCRHSIWSRSVLFAWQVQHLEQLRLAQSVVLYVLRSVLFVNITILNILLLHIIIFLFLDTIILTQSGSCDMLTCISIALAQTRFWAAPPPS